LAHTLAAGLPAVVVPADFDQFDNAARLVAAGVAIRPRRLRDLPRAIARALDDTTIRNACERAKTRFVAGDAEERVATLAARRLVNRSTKHGHVEHAAPRNHPATRPDVMNV
jgi:UDP:flavonoid glycosyltransferase YjiC (YdhE family)